MSKSEKKIIYLYLTELLVYKQMGTARSSLITRFAHL